MCFSASASYTASALLLLCGIIALKRAHSKQRMFAAIPLLFSIQQFLEGMVWQGLSTNSALLPAYGFLFFVYVVWPLWIPLSMRQLGIAPGKSNYFWIPIGAGAIIAFTALGYLITQQIGVSIVDTHIYYWSSAPAWLWAIGTIFYLIATVMPFFIVSGYFWLMGTLLAISYLITFLFFYTTILSVWCFFTAILSVLTIALVG